MGFKVGDIVIVDLLRSLVTDTILDSNVRCVVCGTYYNKANNIGYLVTLYSSWKIDDLPAKTGNHNYYS